jgi:hypothetical protein
MKTIAEKTGSSSPFELVETGIYRKTTNGCYYEHPHVNGRRTWRSLETKNLKHAKEELYRRRAGVVKRDVFKTVTTGEVIRKYQADDYPDQQRQKRPARMVTLETRNCIMLLKFWDKISVEDVTIANCDSYRN